MTKSSVKRVLQAEYSLLCIGHALKQKFDDLAVDSGSGASKIPKFYFNFENSIFGELVSSLNSSGGESGRCLPHSHFIATLLLPCSILDEKIRKFTGNDDMGDANDHITKAVHAFTHFTALYTHKNIILCDLQGMLDHNKVMCLIDPQGHTYVFIS
ncbi:hypothetical protein CVT25_007550 [Psilocybe cyanescens]|uniref:Alpha-type protein kinase domain-containing protein n=1 Tax=Psilocybe cyanescens TaxID=93625 RepID=A0A409WVW7_PSICY|nr:hypothetical protein CVT25_007550 [Psilocybe cyanescens]